MYFSNVIDYGFVSLGVFQVFSILAVLSMHVIDRDRGLLLKFHQTVRSVASTPQLCALALWYILLQEFSLLDMLHACRLSDLTHALSDSCFCS